MAKVTDQSFEHDYDGIKEYDNPMPGWLMAIWWGSLIFSAAYLMYFALSFGETTMDAEYRQDTANALLGYSLHRQLVTDLKASDSGYKRYRLAVLRTLACPGVLVEAAYLSNDAEARRVATPEFRQQIAEAVAEGISNYAATLAALRQPPDPDKK